MKLLGNIIWFVLGGWLLFILYTIAAVIFFPIFLPIFRIARYSLFPFGKGIVTQSQLNKYRKLNGSESEGDDSSQVVDAAKTVTRGAKTVTRGVSGVLNILWMCTAGWILALVHLVASVLNLMCFFLIVTIPNIGGHWKMMRVAFLPFNKVIVPEQLSEEIEVEIVKGKLKI